jgi:hypothetical protein
LRYVPGTAMSVPDLQPNEPSVLMPAGITLGYNTTGALILLLIVIFYLVKSVWSYASTPHTSLMLLLNEEVGKVFKLYTGSIFCW